MNLDRVGQSLLAGVDLHNLLAPARDAIGIQVRADVARNDTHPNRRRQSLNRSLDERRLSTARAAVHTNGEHFVLRENAAVHTRDEVWIVRLFNDCGFHDVSTSNNSAPCPRRLTSEPLTSFTCASI